MRRAVVLGVVLLAGCGWGQARYDSGNTGSNPAERTISAANVARLVPTHRMVSSIPDGVPTFVVARGHVFVDGGPVRAFDEFGIGPCSGSPRTCAPQWSYRVGRFPTVVDGVLHLEDSVGDVDGVRGCAGAPRSCEPIWIESGTGTTTDHLEVTRLHYRTVRVPGHGSELAQVLGYRSTCPATACAAVVTAGFGFGSPGGTIGGPAAADGRVYVSYSAVGAPAGRVTALDPNRTGSDPVWTADLPGGGGTNIAVGGDIVVTNVHTTAGAALVAYDAAGIRNCSGAATRACMPLWRTDAVPSGVDRPPAIAGGVVYRVINDQLRAYDASGATGCSGTPKVCQKLWIADAGPSASAPAVANGLVFVSANDGFVEAFDAHGSEGCSATTRVCGALWSADVNINLGPVEVADGRVFVAAGDGSVRAFALS